MIAILRQAHAAVEDARCRGQPAVGADLLSGLRDQYDEAVALGITLNRLRDWDGGGNHPGYALGCWLRAHADQVWLFTSEFAVEWTSNSAERAVKGPRRHQAVSGYWHTQGTLARWCRIAATPNRLPVTGSPRSTPSAPRWQASPGCPRPAPPSPQLPERRLPGNDDGGQDQHA